MSNAGRPSLVKTHTRASEKKRDDSLNQGISVIVDGTTYTLREGDMTSLDTMALRRETGMSFVSLMMDLARRPDIDLIAAVVWLARRQDGEPMLPFELVASQIDYDSEIDVVDDEPGEEQHPEASGGLS